MTQNHQTTRNTILVKKSGKNVKTGIVDTKAGAYCAVFILSIAGIAALGFKRKINL